MNLQLLLWAREGLYGLSDTEGAIIVGRILAKLKQAPSQDDGISENYFSLLPSSKSLSWALYSSLTDMRLAGLKETCLDLSAFEKNEKGAELQTILVEYARQMEALRLVDYPAAVELVLEDLKQPQRSARDRPFLLWPEDMDITEQEHKLLNCFPKDCLIKLPLQSSDELHGSFSGPSRSISEEGSAQLGMAKPSTSSISSFSAIGEMNEVREIFRQCLSNEIPLDQVELLHTDTETYLPLIFELAHRAGDCTAEERELPVTLAEGIPVRYSRPGRALSAWVSWVRNDFLQSVLETMLQEGLVSTDPAKHKQAEGLTLARLLGSTAIGFKRERYLPALEKLVKSIERELESRSPEPRIDDDSEDARQAQVTKRLQTARSLLDLVNGLLKGAPFPDWGQTAVLDSVKEFLQARVVLGSDFDEHSQRVLINAIGAMSSFLGRIGETNLSIWDWLAGLPHNLRVMGSGPRPGALHVAHVYNGGHTGRRHTFVVGLDDRRFPGGGLQDPVLLDNEREVLSSALPRAADQISKRTDRFLRLLNNLSGDVTLSYPCRNISDDSEMFPSPIMSQILSGTEEEPTKKDSTTEGPVSFAPFNPDESLDMMEWWMARLCRTREVKDSENLLLRYYPHLARGNEAARQRQSDRFTIFDGLVPHSDPNLDPTRSGRLILSPSRLQTIGTCPRKYFFKYVLRLAPPQDLEPDKDTWLDKATFGSLLHDLFHDFVRDRMPYGWPPKYPDCLTQMEDMARRLAEETKERIQPPSEDVYRRQLKELIRSAKVFLEYESTTRDVVPIILEGAFGLKPKGDGKRGSVVAAKPVALNLPNGKTIRVCGIMDRIDKVCGSSSDEWVIRDYKSGSTYSYRSKDPFWQGRLVQHGLYKAMLESVTGTVSELPAARVREFCFFFPGQTERGLPIVYDSSDLKEWGFVVGKLSDILANGAFIATNQVKDCTFCDYTAICGDLEKLEKTVSLKLENQDNVVLEPMRELRREIK